MIIDRLFKGAVVILIAAVIAFALLIGTDRASGCKPGEVPVFGGDAWYCVLGHKP